MIKSLLAIDYSRKQVLTYPYIGVFNNSNNIYYVLFIKPKTGILIYTDSIDVNNEVGKFSADWSEEYYKFTEDAITLKNE